MKTHLSVVFVAVACLFCATATGQKLTIPPQKRSPSKSLDVASLYSPSGWMGDGQHGKKYVRVDEACKINVRPKRTTCIKITYSIGSEGWAGIYWLNEPDNWGDKSGEDFSSRSFKRVSFWAKGERGGEVVEFKSGGVSTSGKQYRDSFSKTTGKISLEKDWKRYELNIEDQNLSSVIGVFCWVANETSNASGLTFYLDEIQYE